MQCEVEYDCAADLNLAFCEVSSCVDVCEMEGACYVEFAYDGEESQ